MNKTVSIKKIVLISCCSKKQQTDIPVKAKDLYISPLFSKAWIYAKDIIKADAVFILSAKYHLLEPDDIISYYNETLTKGKTAKELKQWSEIVKDQLCKKGVDLNKDDIYILAGSKYYKYLIHGKHQNIKCLYEGMRIGQILCFLNNEIRNYEKS